MSQMPTRACAQCGAPLAANQRFCTRCGAVIDMLPGSVAGPTPGGQPPAPQVTPPLPMANPFTPQAPQLWAGQPAPSVPGTPSLAQAPSVPGAPSISQPVHSSAFPAGQPAPQVPMSGPQQVQAHSTFPQQAQAPSMHGVQMSPPQAQGGPFAGHPAQPAAFHASSAPPAQPPAVPGPAPHGLPGASTLHTAGKMAARSARRFGIRALLTKPVIAAVAVVVLAGSAAGIAYSAYRASAPTSFVIGTDRGNNQIVRIDLATRTTIILLSNKVLPGSPDSAIFINSTQMLIDFPGNGEIGIGDIQNGTYTSIRKNLGGALRDMALRPDGSGVLIADNASGTLFEYHTDTGKVSTFAQNVNGVQGLAFDSNGALYAAAGGQVIQLDPTSGKQLRTFNLPGGSDGMAYDGHLHTLDIAVGGSIVTLDPVTGRTTTLIDGIGTADGVAVDRGGNLFIADDFGILELNTSNQLLIVGTNTNGITWDDVAPLSGSGAASY